MQVLAVDVGGTHVKILASGQDAPRRFESGPTLTAAQMVPRVWRRPPIGSMKRSASDTQARCCARSQSRSRTIWAWLGRL